MYFLLMSMYYTTILFRSYHCNYFNIIKLLIKDNRVNLLDSRQNIVFPLTDEYYNKEILEILLRDIRINPHNVCIDSFAVDIHDQSIVKLLSTDIRVIHIEDLSLESSFKLTNVYIAKLLFGDTRLVKIEVMER